MTHWSAAYVGIPFADHGRVREGCDCYGLVRLVYRHELGIDLPDYRDYRSAEEHAEVAALIEGVTAVAPWRQCEIPCAFDLAVFRRGRLATHLGIVIDGDRMLHMVDEDAAKVERLEGPWRCRLIGFWRHRDAPGG